MSCQVSFDLPSSPRKLCQYCICVHAPDKRLGRIAESSRSACIHHGRGPSRCCRFVNVPCISFCQNLTVNRLLPGCLVGNAERGAYLLVLSLFAVKHVFNNLTWTRFGIQDVPNARRPAFILGQVCNPFSSRSGFVCRPRVRFSSPFCMQVGRFAG